MNSNIQNIKDIWNNRLNTLVDMEEYEMAKKTKDLLDKLDTFIKMKDTVEDTAFYEQMERQVVISLQNIVP